MRPAAAVPATLEAATAHQPAARAALSAALAAGPGHAYELVGPKGSGKRAAARAFAAELLAAGSDDPDWARRRALAEPSPHPDLAWLSPAGNQHLVTEVRERVITAIPYRPFEGTRRVFVIEAAEAMAEESQNALLKTLEEPPPYAHLLLVSSEPTGLLETVRSRCQPVPFGPLPREAVAERLAAASELAPETRAALAALADGDADRALLLASERGQRLRGVAERCARAALARTLEDRPWMELLNLAAEIGKGAATEVEEATEGRAAEFGEGRDATRLRREGTDAAKRVDRRARTAAIDEALALCGAWFVDLLACLEGAPEIVRNVDRRTELEADAKGREGAAVRRAAELTLQTRRRLQVNVGEELALESLFHRIASTLGET